MSYFLSEQYQKPKLVENRTIKSIIESQPIQLDVKDTFVDDIFKSIIETLKNNYKFIFIIIIVCLSLYWRYYEIQKIKKKNSEYDSDSDSDSDKY
jgi:hypothetical protein